MLYIFVKILFYIKICIYIYYILLLNTCIKNKIVANYL